MNLPEKQDAFSCISYVFSKKKQPVKNNVQGVTVSIFFSIEIKMHDGIHWTRFRRIFFFELLYGKPFEQFLLPQKICLQRGKEQALAEPARTGKKIRISAL
jgi:hypothetical protein